MGMATIEPYMMSPTEPEPVNPFAFDIFITDPTWHRGKTTINQRCAGRIVSVGLDDDKTECFICAYTTEKMHPLDDSDLLNVVEYIPKQFFTNDGSDVNVGDLVVWFSGRADVTEIGGTHRVSFTEYRYFPTKPPEQ